MKKLFSLILRAGMSIALLVFLFSKIDFRATFKTILTLQPLYMSLAVAVFVLIYVLCLYRWRTLLVAQGINLPLMRIVSSFSGGIFFSLFLPSTIGGDVARSIDLGLHTKRHSVIIASVLLDRLSGFVGLVLVALVSLLAGHRYISEPSVYTTIFIVAGILFAILTVIFNTKIYNGVKRRLDNKGSLGENIRELHSEIYYFRKKPAILLGNLLFSILVQAASSVSSFFILRALHSDIKFIYPFILNPVIIAIATLPISIGGLGLRDASSVFFYTKVGVTHDTALAHSLLNFALMVIFGLIGGLIYLFTLHYRRRNSHVG